MGKIELSGLRFDLNQPYDISIPINGNRKNVNCFHAPDVEFLPVASGDFIGSTQEGGPLNFMNIRINPHGNGTHTECVGHISKEPFTINRCLRNFHFIAQLVSVKPTELDDGDLVVTEDQVKALDLHTSASALIIRTLPNDPSKKVRNYSGSNPPYFESSCMNIIVEHGIDHLLVDLPSVDREEDGGALSSHKEFWQYPGRSVRKNATISELIYVDNKVNDGLYLLNLQICSLELDVSPSKPVLYPVIQNI